MAATSALSIDEIVQIALRHADATFESADANDAERAAIQKFCSTSLVLKESQHEYSEHASKMRTEINALRARIQSTLETRDITCMQLPRPSADEQLELVTHGFEDFPKYIRVMHTFKKSALTPELVAAAIRALPEQTVRDAYESSVKKGRDTSATHVFIDALIALVNKMRSTPTAKMSMSNSIERGCAAVDVPVAPPRLAANTFDLFRREQRLKRLLASRKHHTKGIVEKIASLEEPVQKFLDRVQSTEQDVTLRLRSGGAPRPVRVRKKTSTRKQAITVGFLTTTLLDSVTRVCQTPAHCALGSILSAFASTRDALADAVQAALEAAQRERVTRARITMDAIGRSTAKPIDEGK